MLIVIYYSDSAGWHTIPWVDTHGYTRTLLRGLVSDGDGRNAKNPLRGGGFYAPSHKGLKYDGAAAQSPPIFQGV